MGPERGTAQQDSGPGLQTLGNVVSKVSSVLHLLWRLASLLAFFISENIERLAQQLQETCHDDLNMQTNVTYF